MCVCVCIGDNGRYKSVKLKLSKYLTTYLLSTNQASITIWIFIIVQTASHEWSKIDHDWSIDKFRCVNEDGRGHINTSMGVWESTLMVKKHELKFSYSGILAFIDLILDDMDT